MNEAAAPLVSLVIPVRDEAAAIPALTAEIAQVFSAAGVSWEAVWVDDGSRDNSRALLRGLTSPQRFIAFERSCGQSAALLAGVLSARGEWIATLDGDGQNDPADLPGLLSKARAESFDLINGIRTHRHDGWLRRLSSRIANRVRSWVTGPSVIDTGCSTRVIRRTALLTLPRFDELHRFLPTLVRMQGGRIGELAVNHRSRAGGRSKYGVLNRLFRGVRDLLGVRWLMVRQRPWQVVEASSLPESADFRQRSDKNDHAQAEARAPGIIR
ncbi:MAG TPA: glycosyltransferase family 2 protein [Planctomycetota bacterium]|nr:glycosyltransferase family 2 protein [Planctomycetota bacterium]